MAASETEAVGPVYLAGPITPVGDRTLEQNVSQAANCLAYLTARRVAAICPQLTQTRAELDAIDYEDWMAVDFVLLGACKAVLALPGWDTSAGTRRELLFAATAGIPVFYNVRPLFDYLGVAPRAARPPQTARP